MYDMPVSSGPSHARKAPQYPNLSYGHDYQLLDWLQHITFPREKMFENTSYARKVYAQVVDRVIRMGTTTCCYYGTIHLEATKILADICHERGQRAFVGKCNMDRNSVSDYVEASSEESIKSTHQLIEHIESVADTLVKPILTPRFAISTSPDLLQSLGELAAARPDIPIQTHLSENAAEIALTQELFPSADHYTAVYDTYSLLRHSTILAHCVHLGNAEVDLIKSRACGISHCPTSNFNVRSGICPVEDLLQAGIKIGLGTDVSGGFQLGILTTIRNASVAAKALSNLRETSGQKSVGYLSIPKLFFLATLGGAQVCCLEDRIGNFQVGKDFDALLISPTLGDNPSLMIEDQDSVEVVLEKFLFAGDDRNISKVFVRGRVIGDSQVE